MGLFVPMGQSFSVPEAPAKGLRLGLLQEVPEVFHGLHHAGKARCWSDEQEGVLDLVRRATRLPGLDHVGELGLGDAHRSRHGHFHKPAGLLVQGPTLVVNRLPKPGVGLVDLRVLCDQGVKVLPWLHGSLLGHKNHKPPAVEWGDVHQQGVQQSAFLCLWRGAFRV